MSWRKPLHGLQDTNDKYLGNIQRDGTFSVIPRVAGGEISPDKLIVIGQVAKKYGLYTKITGGQRIDMFGAKKQDLLDIWSELVAGGLESGHAYAKSLRNGQVVRRDHVVPVWHWGLCWTCDTTRREIQVYSIAA